MDSRRLREDDLRLDRSRDGRIESYDTRESRSEGMSSDRLGIRDESLQSRTVRYFLRLRLVSSSRADRISDLWEESIRGVFWGIFSSSIHDRHLIGIRGDRCEDPIISESRLDESSVDLYRPDHPSLLRLRDIIDRDHRLRLTIIPAIPFCIIAGHLRRCQDETISLDEKSDSRIIRRDSYELLSRESLCFEDRNGFFSFIVDIEISSICLHRVRFIDPSYLDIRLSMRDSS